MRPGEQRTAASICFQLAEAKREVEQLSAALAAAKKTANALSLEMTGVEIERGDVPLTPREREVLSELLARKVNKEIACVLNMSVRTVKFHVSALLRKFRVSDRHELRARVAG